MNKPKPNTKKKDPFSREELFAGIDKAFTLGDSEIIADKTIEFILKLVMNKSRLRYVESLMNDFIVDKTFQVFNELVDMEYSTKLPDEDKVVTCVWENKEIKDDPREGSMLFEIPKPKIDAWACNKAKIVIVKPNEIPGYTNEIQDFHSTYRPVITHTNTSNAHGKSFFGKLLPALKKGDKDKEKENTTINNKTNQELRESTHINNNDLKSQLVPSYLEKNSSNLSSFNRTSNIGSMNNNNYPNSNTKESANSNTNTNSNTNKNKLAQRLSSFSPVNKKEELVIEQYAIEDDDNNIEPIDELEQIKLKTLRIYFREREMERERKRKLEKEQEEKNTEDDKKRKKLMEEMNKKPFSYDFEGKIMNVKPPEVEKMYYPPSASTKIVDKQLVLSDEGRKEREERKKKKTTRRGAEMKYNPNYPNEDKPENQFSYPPRYYQPDPMTSHEISPGVLMEFYGMKKEGGKFPDIPGRLSFNDFYTLLSMYKPNNKFISFENPDLRRRDRRNKEDIDKIAEAEERMEKESMRLERIFSDTESSYEDEEKRRKLAAQKKEDILKGSHSNITHTKQRLYEIRKKQKADKIRALKEFSLDKMNRIDDERLYEVFNAGGEEVFSVFKARSVNMPKKVHVSKEKELGVMKKYPRERVGKDILAMTGKIKIVTSRNKDKEATKPIITSTATVTSTEGNNPFAFGNLK